MMIVFLKNINNNFKLVIIINYNIIIINYIMISLIRKKLEQLRHKIFLKQKTCLEKIANKDISTQKIDENEIFILEYVYDNWQILYNEDNKEFWKNT